VSAKWDRKPDDLIEAAFQANGRRQFWRLYQMAKSNRDNDWIEAILSNISQPDNLKRQVEILMRSLLFTVATHREVDRAGVVTK